MNGPQAGILVVRPRLTITARTLRAIQLASALSAGCTAFVTGDRRLPSLPGLRVLALADYA